MRLKPRQSSEGNLRVAMRSVQSPLPSTRPILNVDRISNECRPSFTCSDERLISPSPLNDHPLRSSISSSSRELRTALLSQRYSAPSRAAGCMGTGGEDDCIVCAAAARVNRKPMLAPAAKESRQDRLHEGAGVSAISFCLQGNRGNERLFYVAALGTHAGH